MSIILQCDKNTQLVQGAVNLRPEPIYMAVNCWPVQTLPAPAFLLPYAIPVSYAPELDF